MQNSDLNEKFQHNHNQNLKYFENSELKFKRIYSSYNSKPIIDCLMSTEIQDFVQFDLRYFQDMKALPDLLVPLCNR